MFSGRPTSFSASGCWRSRLRWHSGHGVTRQSASASTASPRCVPGLLERGLLVHRDDREAAALVRAGVVDHRAAERLDQHLQVAVARVLLVDAEAVGRAHDVAAVERADAQVGQRPLDLRLDRVEPDLLDHQPQEVLVGDALLVASGSRRASVSLTCSRYSVFASRRSWHSLCAPWQVEQMFIIRSAPSAISCWASANVRALSVSASSWLCSAITPAPRAARAVELDELDVQQRRDLRHRAVQLGGEAAAHAAGPVGDLHASGASSTSSSSPTT